MSGWQYEPTTFVGSRDYTLIWAKSVKVSEYVTPAGSVYFGAISGADGELHTCFATQDATAVLRWLEEMAWYDSSKATWGFGG